MSDTINTLAWPALRYALGRRTYVTDLVARCLIRCKKEIRSDIKQSMIRDVEKAIAEGEAGMDCDIECWLKLVEELKKDG